MVIVAPFRLIAAVQCDVRKSVKTRRVTRTHDLWFECAA